VDEWCADWYAPYAPDAAMDPLGPSCGEFRVLRGGSHSTEAKYLRSGARSGSLPEDRSHGIGIRLCMMDEPRKGSHATPDLPSPLWAAAVSQAPASYAPYALQNPRFDAPRPFVRLPEDLKKPRYAHNHGPTLAICPNGDLLAAWFSCPRESGREMAILASRLRRGAESWDEASIFWAPPNRNASCTVLMERDGALYHFNGLSACATWANVATAVRRSDDNGATWSPMRIVQPDHQIVCMPSGNSPFWHSDGRAMLPCDTISVDVSVTGKRGSCLLAGDPDGEMEVLPDGIAGIHAAVAECRDHSLLAFGRANLEGCMPMSRSEDGGRSWHVEKTAFPFIHMGQRPVLQRLPGGALFLASFAREGFEMDGRRFNATGLFGALSYDEGKTWPVLRPIVPDQAGGTFEGGAWTGTFQMDALHAEPRGYLTAAVAADGTIHLLSSGIHYAFNEAWLTQPGKE
ncbi:MAG TPA: exo-alpha-sialidase, partial [Clostridia bacterium]|nr:exo-alpha-sialidase [Clostridia bacterium]